MYEKWSSGIPEEYALVVYDSMWHTTEAMATEITEAFIEMGIPARLLDLKVNHISDIMAEVLNARYIAVGSPTLNKTMMPTVASFLCYMRGLAPGRARGHSLRQLRLGAHGPQRGVPGSGELQVHAAGSPAYPPMGGRRGGSECPA